LFFHATTMTLLRTAHDGCWELATNSWGTFLRPVADPDANVTITDEQLKGFELRTDISKIPADLWQRWIQLCFAMTEASSANLEVSCRLLRHEDDRSRWRILVPRQEVSAASVRVKSFDRSVDIATGEVIEQYPPIGWIPCGSSHSHNTMAAFFSGTDDKYELGDPGLHIVVGAIDLTKRNYTLAASITANHRRFLIEHDAVIDTTPVSDVSYHPDARAMVAVAQPRATAGAVSWGKSSGFPSWRTIGHYQGGDSEDPFYWSDSWSHASRQVSNRPDAAPADEDAEILLATIADALHELQDKLSPEVVRKLDELNWQIHDVISDRTLLTCFDT
jgi:hypothetical protein